MAFSFAKMNSQSQMVIQSMLGLLCLSCVVADVEPCQSALDNGKINPISKSGSVWKVDPFIIPPKGTCKQMPVDDEGMYLNMDFDAYPSITAQCDDKINFVMRTVSRQQRHGVYLAEFNGNVTADSSPPCPPPVFNNQKLCDVRLNESDQKDTQCQGYTQLYPLLMFGPNDTIIKEYTTASLRTMVAAGKDTDVLVFSCPWIKGRRGTSGVYSSHCDNGMFVKVTVQGCMTPAPVTCGDVKRHFKKNGCCGNPHKAFHMDRRLKSASSQQESDELIVSEVEKTLQRAGASGDKDAVQKVVSKILAMTSEYQ